MIQRPRAVRRDALGARLLPRSGGRLSDSAHPVDARPPRIGTNLASRLLFERVDAGPRLSGEARVMLRVAFCLALLVMAAAAAGGGIAAQTKDDCLACH